MVREADKTYTLWLSASVDIHSGTELILVPDSLYVCWVHGCASITQSGLRAVLLEQGGAAGGERCDRSR